MPDLSLSTTQWTFIGVGAVLFFWCIGGYNRLVALRTEIGAAWAQFEAPVLRRAEVCAQLIQQLRTVLSGEHHVLDAALSASAQVAAAADTVRRRPTSADAVASLSVAESLHAGAMTRLLALADQFVALRPSDVSAPEITAAAHALRETEAKITFARQWFNEKVSIYNEAARQFPTHILARLFGFGPGGSL